MWPTLSSPAFILRLEPVGNFLYGAANYGTLQKENELLRQELANEQTAFGPSRERAGNSPSRCWRRNI